MAEQWLTREVAGLVGPLVPAGPVRTAATLSAFAAIVVSVAVAPEMPRTVEVVTSTPALLGSVVQALVLSGALLAWLAPSAGLALTAAAMLATGVMPAAHQGVPLVWLVLGSLLAVLSAVDLVSRVRRSALARQVLASAEPVAPPALSAAQGAALLRSGRWRRGVALLLLAAAVASAAWWQRDSAAAAAFRARAEEVPATVEAVAEDGLSIEVTLDGASVHVPTTSLDHAVGQPVTVRIDRATGRAEITDDVFDPSMVLVLTVPCAVVALTLFLRARRLRRQLHDLLTSPHPALHAVATGAPRSRGVLLSPVDDLTMVAGTARHLVMVAGPMVAAVWASHGAEQGEDSRHGRDRHLEDEVDEPDDWPVWPELPADGPGPLPGPGLGGRPPSIWARPDVSAMSDDQLLQRAKEPIWPDRDEWPPAGPVGWSRQPVLVSGRLDQDGPVLVHRLDEVYLASAGLQHRRWRSVRQSGRPAAEPRTASATFRQAYGEALLRLGLAAGVWLPWLLLPVVAAASWWVVSMTGPSLRLLATALGLATIPWMLAVTGTPVLTVRPRRLRFSSMLTDTYIPWGRVTGEAVDGDALVVRFDDGRPGGDALLVRSDPKLRRLSVDGASTVDLAARIRAARALSAFPGRVLVVPSPGLLAALAWIAAMLVPALVR